MSAPAPLLLLLLLLLLLWGAAPGLAQFPRPCATTEALLSRECCPLWAGDGSPCGALSGRGVCAPVLLPSSAHGTQYPFSGVDDRERWPRVFYDRVCNCSGHFMGFDCSGCAFGWGGASCGEQRATLRRNVLSLSGEERRRLLSYLQLAKSTQSEDYVIAVGHHADMGNGSLPRFANVSVYDLFVWLHYYVSHATLLGGPGNVWRNVDFGHWAPAFPLWHRVYLLLLEEQMRKLTGDVTFALPYWDWRDAQDCQVCTDELLGSRSASNPNQISPASIFSSWQVICSRAEEYNRLGVLCDGSPEGPLLRNPGNHDSRLVRRLPTSADVEFTVNLADYDTGAMDRTASWSFRNTLEGRGDLQTGQGNSQQLNMHASLHVFMNGSMTSVQGSANDPIFFLHHAFVDSIYERWLRTHQPNKDQYPHANAPIGHNAEDFMVPFLPLFRNGDFFVSSRELGYDYAYLLDPGQRFVQELWGPFVQQVQRLWPWLLVGGLLGALLAVMVCVAIVTGLPRCRRLWHRRPAGLVQEEKEPLLSGDKNVPLSYHMVS